MQLFSFTDYKSHLRHIGMHPVVETKVFFFFFSLGCSVCWSLEQPKSGVGPENRHHGKFHSFSSSNALSFVVVTLPVSVLHTVAVKLLLLLLLLLQSLLYCCRGHEGLLMEDWEVGSGM